MARIDAYLVCGGRFHDFDFARLELLKLLHEDDRVRTKVAQDFRDVDAIARADLLVTYTCDVRPSQEEQDALRAWVEGGGRWFALHATNSALDGPEQMGQGPFTAPRAFPTFVETIGSQFLAHPPMEPFRVHVTDPDHPLTKGIEDFDTPAEELYLSEFHAPVTTLLETRWSGTLPPNTFADAEWPDDDPRPVMYLRELGQGAVLHNTLGHCRSRYDLMEYVPEYPRLERGSWELPVYHELLRRGLDWAKAG